MGQEIVIIGAISKSDEVAQNPDLVLMQRLRQGDASAMDELVHRFGPNLNRLVDRLTCWSADSDDILQEVFLTAWRKAAAYRGTGSLEGWLRKLTVNRCRNHHRARAAFVRMVERFAMRAKDADELRSHDEDPSYALQIALGKLRATDRAVLVLFYLEELSGEQVADAMNVPPSTIHMRVHRARERLRGLLNAEDGLDEKR